MSSVSPELLRRWRAFMAAWIQRHGPTQFRINSGFRTRAEQARLYTKAQRAGTVAARPGTSLHERGLAIDVSLYDPRMRRWRAIPLRAKKMLADVGLSQLPGNLGRRDPWHIQPLELTRGRSRR